MRCRYYSLAVERLQRVHIKHTGMDAMVFQHSGGLHTMCHGLTSTDEREVGAIYQHIGFPRDKIEIIVLIYIGYGIATYTDIGRFLTVDKQSYQPTSLTDITGQINLHARESAQHSDVVQGMMGGPQLTVGNTTTHTKDFDRHLRIG